MEAFTNDQLMKIDWLAEPQPTSHPHSIRVTPVVVYHLETGEPIAHTAPGYRFCWIHNHVHIVPNDWIGDEAEFVPRIQQARPLGGD